MRQMLQVQRSSDPYGPAGVGHLASRLLALVRDVSDIRVEREYSSIALLSFEDNDHLDSFSEIDGVLETRGLRRLHARDTLPLLRDPRVTER